MPVHIAQTWTYLRLSGHSVALLMNFHAILLKNGLRRLMLQSDLPSLCLCVSVPLW